MPEQMLFKAALFNDLPKQSSLKAFDLEEERSPRVYHLPSSNSHRLAVELFGVDYSCHRGAF